MTQHLFVYGTLRRNARRQIHHLLCRYASFVGEAIYRGKLYNIGLYPGAVPSDNPMDRVLGEVYRLQEPLVVLAQLDQYEGCGPEVLQPAEYRREIQDVRLVNGGQISAWVYLYNRPTYGLELIRSGDFFKR